MKITLTGAAGNITKPLAEKLLAAGHQVSVVGRNAENLKPLTDKGAIPKIGSIEDGDFIKEAFKGAEAVYTMIPAPYHLEDWVTYGKLIGENYRSAIEKNGIKKVVNLSTYGAHKIEGIGAIASIGQLELALAKLTNTEVIHLRAGFFYNNLYRLTDTLKSTGIFGSNYGNSDSKIILVHTNDIADIAAKAIQDTEFPSKEPYYVVSDIKSWNEIAKAISKELNQTITWTSFPNDSFQQALVQNGFPNYLIDVLLEIGNGIATGKYTEHYFSLTKKPELGKIKLEEFAKEFALAFNQNEA